MSDPQPTTKPVTPETTPIVLEAIVRRHAIAATYNRMEITLAPHILYTKHGELHVDGVTLERDGKPPKELKLGVFKLIGLSALRITPRQFEISKLYVPGEPRYEGETVMAVQP